MGKFDFETIYVGDYTGKLEELWMAIIDHEPDHCFIFWRCLLNNMYNPKVILKLLQNHQIPFDSFLNFINKTGFFSAVYDHAFTSADYHDSTRNCSIALSTVTMCHRTN